MTAKHLAIRVANPRDTPALSQLAISTYADAFGHTMSAPDLAAHLAARLTTAAFNEILDADTVLVAEVAGQLVGYVQFGPTGAHSAGKRDYELRRLYVKAEFQNEGVASALLIEDLAHSMLADAENVFLEVWEHNYGAQRLYRRFGFAIVGTQVFEVESGAPTSMELVMVRRIVKTEQLNYSADDTDKRSS